MEAGGTNQAKSDYQVISAAAGWVARSDFEVLELTGQDRISFLNSYNSQDIKNLPTGRSAYGTVQTLKGKLVSDTWILNLPEKILLIVAPGFGQKILEHWKTFLLFANVELVDRTEEWAHVGAFGPKADALIRAWFGQDPPAEPGPILSLPVENASAYLVASLGFGIPGWEIFAPRAAQETITAEWQEKGRSLGIPRVSPEALEIFRVEAGLPKMGVDMSEDNLVAEVGLDKRATSFNKGCYLGQETTARVNSQGHVNRSLTRFKLSRPFQGQLPADIFAADKSVGTLTSLAHSPRFQGVIGLGLVHRMAGESALFVHDSEGKIELTRL